MLGLLMISVNNDDENIGAPSLGEGFRLTRSKS